MVWGGYVNKWRQKTKSAGLERCLQLEQLTAAGTRGGIDSTQTTVDCIVCTWYNICNIQVTGHGTTTMWQCGNWSLLSIIRWNGKPVLQGSTTERTADVYTAVMLFFAVAALLLPVVPPSGVATVTNTSHARRLHGKGSAAWVISQKKIHIETSLCPGYSCASK